MIDLIILLKKLPSLLLYELLKELFPDGMLCICQDSGRGFGKNGSIILHEIPHESDKYQIDGLMKCFPNRKDVGVVGFVEIGKGMDSASCPKPFMRACGITAFQCGLEYVLKVGFGRGVEIRNYPVG